MLLVVENTAVGKHDTVIYTCCWCHMTRFQTSASDAAVALHVRTGVSRLGSNHRCKQEALLLQRNRATRYVS